MKHLTNTDLTPMSSILSIKKTIPAYQRDFVWEEGLIKNFLENIYEAFDDDMPNYFTGSMVLYKANDVYEIVDGQQRTTVLYTLVSELIRRLIESDPENDAFKHSKMTYLAAYSRKGSSGKGKTTKDYLFTHKKKEIRDYLELIAEGNTESTDQKDNSVLMAALITCRDVVREFVSEKLVLEDDIDRLEDFLSYILDQVNVVHYAATDINEALLIYSRLNSGGKALGHLEIIKGQLFSQIADQTDENWNKLDDLWEKFWTVLKTRIQIGGNRHFKDLIAEDTFISYYFFVKHPDIVRKIARVSDGFLPTKKISEFLLDTRLVDELLGDSFGFLEELIEFAEDIAAIRKGDHTDETVQNTLHDIALLSKTQTQPLMFLLSCKSDDKLFADVLDQVFSLIFIFSMSVTGSGSTSAAWKKLSSIVFDTKKTAKSSELQAIVKEALDDELKKFWRSNFVPFFEALNISQDKTKIKTILHVLEVAVRRSSGEKDNIHYKDYCGLRGYDVDHLSPEDQSEIDPELQVHLSDDVIQSIGNATLLTHRANRGLKNTPFYKKRKQQALRDSDIFVTKAIVMEGSEAFGMTRDGISQFSTIDLLSEDSVEHRRQEMLKVLKSFCSIKEI